MGYYAKKGGLLLVAHLLSHSTPLMGPYFFPINSPLAINLLPHGLLRVAHGILGNLLFLAIDSAFFLILAVRITPQPLYLQLHPLI